MARRWWVGWWLLVGLATRGFAAPAWVSSFESPDANVLPPSACVANCADSMECTVTSPGGDSTAGECALQSSPVCVPHNNLNGGVSTSTRTFRANTTGTNAGYCEIGSNAACAGSGAPYACCTGSGAGDCGLAGLTQGTIGASIHQNAAPGIAYKLLEMMEDSSTTDCFARVNTDRTVTVCYRDCTTGINFGTTARKLQRDFCGGGSCTVDGDCADLGYGICIGGTCKNIGYPCTAASEATDCPSGQTCGTCDMAGAATGANCYHGGLELVQSNQGSSVLCELWWDGAKVITSGPRAATPATLTRFRFGKTGSENGTVVVSVDDVVISTEDRVGWGYVAPVFPITDGTSQQFTVDNCGAGSTFERCIDDWEGTGVYGNSGTQDTLKASTTGKVQEIGRFTSASGFPTVTAVNVVVVGRDSGTGSGTGTIGGKILQCSTATSCEYAATETTASVDFTLDTHRQLLRVIAGTTPNPNASVWNDATIGQLGFRTIAESVTSNSIIRPGAVVAYIRARRADAPLAITLRDHDLGTNDGKVTLCTSGDSTNGGTQAVTCQGGEKAGVPCSQSTYCSDFSGPQDKPIGGCTTDAQCQTCASRQSEFGSGAGYPCGTNNGGATCNLGTCGTSGCEGGITNCCSGDGTVSCTVNGDCDLGLCAGCDTAACSGGADNSPDDTCVQSCPSGSCPTNRTAWGDFIAGFIGADNVIRAGFGGDTYPFFLAGVGRFSTLLQGRDYISAMVAGTPGACTCTTGTATADCGTGGACTNGLCTAGDASKTACRYTFDPAGSGQICNFTGGRVCQLPECDYLMTWEGDNDALGGLGTPDCTGITSISASVAASTCNLGCPTLACEATSTCTASRAADSECLAGLTYNPTTGIATNTTCYQDAPDSGVRCTLQATPCDVTSDCTDAGLAGFTCSGGGTGRQAGYCNCGADGTPGNCDSGFACKNGTCRRTCTADNECGTGQTCASSICTLRCTCPCDSSDIPAPFTNTENCTSDTDCTSNAITPYLGATRHWQKRGKCVAGKCRCCGATVCTDGTCDQRAYVWQATRGHHVALDAIAGMNKQLNVLNAGDSDGGPVLIWATLPSPPYADGECAATESRPNAQYFAKTSQHLLRDRTRFPHVMDFRSALAPYAKTSVFADVIHPNATGASILGAKAVSYLETLNVCAKNAGTPQATVQKYCKNNAGTFTSTTCNDNTGCSSTQQCTTRPCGTCTCGVAGDCAASGGTCAGGICTAGDPTKLACVADTACAATRTCSFLAANCPASADSCNYEAGAR